MKSSILLVGLILSFLSGCAAAERPVLALAPDQERDHTTQRPVDARPKTKIAKQAQPRRPAQPVSAPEPPLPPWNVASPKPSRILRSTPTPSQLFEKVSPAVYAVTALAQATQHVPSHGSAVAVSSKASRSWSRWYLWWWLGRAQVGDDEPAGSEALQLTDFGRCALVRARGWALTASLVSTNCSALRRRRSCVGTEVRKT
jgi:hypothetical protein